MSAERRFVRELQTLSGYVGALVWLWLLGWTWALVGLAIVSSTAALTGAYAFGQHRAAPAALPGSGVDAEKKQP